MHKVTIIDHVGKKAGMDYYSSSLAKGFVEQNIQCTVYSNFTGTNPEEIAYLTYYDGHTQKNILSKMIHFLSATLKSSYISRKQKVDLVIMHLFSANLITLLLVLIPKLFGLRITLIAHDISSFINSDSSMVQNLLYNFLSDHIVVHNNFSYNELLKHVNLTDSKKVTIIRHGGYLEHISEPLSKATARKALGLDIDGKYILFFGQIKEVKGLDILLEAMATIPEDIKLIIAGKPWKSDFDKYDALIKKHNLDKRTVRMIRFIEDDEREKLFFAADVNILPYRIIYQSGVLLMAMSHGLPVIASDLPANKEIIIHKENGILFKNGDKNELSKQITHFFQNKDLSKNISAKALETIRNKYRWDNIAKSYINMFKTEA